MPWASSSSLLPRWNWAPAAAVLVTGFIALDGKSNWLEGAMLCGIYVIAALAFFFSPCSRPRWMGLLGSPTAVPSSIRSPSQTAELPRALGATSIPVTRLCRVETQCAMRYSARTLGRAMEGKQSWMDRRPDGR